MRRHMTKSPKSENAVFTASVHAFDSLLLAG